MLHETQTFWGHKPLKAMGKNSRKRVQINFDYRKNKIKLLGRELLAMVEKRQSFHANMVRTNRGAKSDFSKD